MGLQAQELLMDDLLALDGGSSATKWQKRHARRKASEAALKLRRQVRAEAKADLKKRTKKWRAKWKTEAEANKAIGLPPPSRKGRPRDMSKPQWVDMTGQRFGKLTVLRIAPISKNGKQRCRRWWVKCDCGHAEHLVSGTCLRQGIARSCGCLKADVGKARRERRLAELQRLQAAPLSVQVAALRQKILNGRRIILADAKTLHQVRRLLRRVEAEAAGRVDQRTSKMPFGAGQEPSQIHRLH
jgi:hypothetical protein